MTNAALERDSGWETTIKAAGHCTQVFDFHLVFFPVYQVDIYLIHNAELRIRQLIPPVYLLAVFALLLGWQILLGAPVVCTFVRRVFKQRNSKWEAK